MDEHFAQFPQEHWDACFEGGRYIVISRLGPFWRVFQRPPLFRRRFWHTVHELPIRDWRLVLESLHLGQFCVIESEVHIRYQPSIRYAHENLDFIADLPGHIEHSMGALIKDLAEEEIRNLVADPSWLEKGLDDIEKSVAAIINELLVTRGVHCRTVCHVEPRFAAVDSVDLDGLPPWPRHQAVYEEYLRRCRAARERILREQTDDAANARRLLMEREITLLELARQEEEIRKTAQQQELASLQSQLSGGEARWAEQLNSEIRKQDEKSKQQARLSQLQSEMEAKEREARLAKQRADCAAEADMLAEQQDAELRRREEQIQHQARIRLILAEAKSKAREGELENHRARLASEATERQERNEAELRQYWEKLQQAVWLKTMQAETDKRTSQAELQHQQAMEEARLASQRESVISQRREQLRHEATLLQLQAEAELDRRKAELARLQAEMSQLEVRMEQQREHEARALEQQLRHESRLRAMRSEQDLREKEHRAAVIPELEGYLSREIGLLATERQRLKLEEEIRLEKLARTPGLLSSARRRLSLGQDQDSTVREDG